MCGWIDVLQALLTPLIAVIAAYVAWQQWSTNRSRLKHELFDRRYELYAHAHNVLFYVSSRDIAPAEALSDYRQTLHKSDFLLDKSLSSLLSEIIDKHSELDSLVSELAALTADKRKENIRKQREIKNWMEAQKDVLKTKFAKFLKIDV